RHVAANPCREFQADPWRSRSRVTLHPPPLDRSPRAAWRSGSATMRTAGIGARTTAVDDAIGPVTVDFLRAQIEAKPFAHHTGEEAADGVLLPLGRAHDRSNRPSLRP